LLTLLPLRPGAAAALTVADFDAKRRALTVPEEKGHRSRVIALPLATAAFIARCAKGKSAGDPLVGRSDGRAWDKDSWKIGVKKAVSAAKLDDGVSAYTLRHSTITDLVKKVDVLTVAELSGTSIQIIQKHYFKRGDEDARRALAHLNI